MTVRHSLTILAVENLQESCSFYQHIFEWQISVNTTVYIEFALPEGQRFGLYEKNGFARNIGQMPELTQKGKISGTELYFYCDDIERIIERFEKIDAHLLSPLAVRPWGDEAVYYADPSGNVLVIARPIKQ